MRDKGKAVVVVQARLGSTRLPGKVLSDIAGHPMLWHVLERAREIQGVNRIILAVPYASPEEEEECFDWRQLWPGEVIWGPELDVLQRFLLALRGTGAEYLVRVCSDAPLFDPGWVNDCLGIARDCGVDTVRAHEPCCLSGAGVYSTAALARVWFQAPPNEPRAKEHVTSWAPCPFSIATLNPPEWSRCDLKLSVDTRDDLERIRKVYEALYCEGDIISTKAAVQWLKEHP